ncbi:hypothetical protein ABK948_00705 [Citrobacter sp. 70972423]|uniref:hypothetical protein n=1 Tax=Citrobacter sp. 70972423 TaxID=3118148 RepID=UPI0037546162
MKIPNDAGIYMNGKKITGLRARRNKGNGVVIRGNLRKIDADIHDIQADDNDGDGITIGDPEPSPKSVDERRDDSFFSPSRKWVQVVFILAAVATVIALFV